jgi:hypothetical protein
LKRHCTKEIAVTLARSIAAGAFAFLVFLALYVTTPGAECGVVRLAPEQARVSGGAALGHA